MLTYAEVHYRPWFVPSLISMRSPEIVCDAPTRVEPGRPIPLFVFVKDADRYPIELETIVIHAVYESGVEKVARFPYDGLTLDLPIWWDSFNIVPEFNGLVKLYPHVIFKKGRKRSVVHVDNYRGSTGSPLIVYAASDHFPGGEGWYRGDIHCHTYYTSDQVEFGAPIEALTLAAHCMGLDWIAVTDHSYDLDDMTNDYFKEDILLPLRSKWIHAFMPSVNPLSRAPLWICIAVTPGVSRSVCVHSPRFNKTLSSSGIFPIG